MKIRQRLLLLLLMIPCIILIAACSDKQAMNDARIAFQTHFDALIDNDMQTLAATTSSEFREAFLAKADVWGDPFTTMVAKSLYSRFDYKILEIKSYGKDIVIKAHFSKPDYNDMEQAITQAISNTDVEAFANAGYSQEEFDRAMQQRMLVLIQQGNYKMKEADISILLVKESDGWKVQRDLMPENISEDWF